MSKHKTNAQERRDRVGTKTVIPPSPIQTLQVAATMAAATAPPPNPITGKTYRPGERLERQARKYARERTEKRPRDYEAYIAKLLSDLR